MRELSGEPCEVTFFDKISGENMTHYYQAPTTQERITYTNGAVTRRGNKIVSTLGELRIKAGAKIYVGFKRGAYGIPVKGPVSIMGLSKAAACIISWREHRLITGDKVLMEEIIQADWIACNGKHKITRIDDDSFSIPIDSSAFASTYNAATDSGTIKGYRLISSKPGEPNYEPAWKTIVHQFASDVLEAIAIHAFEGSLQAIALPSMNQLDILPPTSLDDWGLEPNEAAEGKTATEEKEENPL